MLLARPLLAEEGPYRIQPGDVLNVTVSPQAAYGRVVTVQPDGKLSYPVAGELAVSGKTIQELSQLLARGLEKELNRPQVTVSIQTTAPRPAPQITVLGAVQAPGLFNLRPGWRLTEALAAAGGPKPNADLHRITITGKDQKIQTADLMPGAIGGTTGNREVREGDLILVLEGDLPRQPSITVLGAVRSPGLFPLQTGWRLTEALAAAGGPSAEADLERISITHADRTLEVVSMTAASDGMVRDNQRVRDGDLILLLEAKRSRPTVTVLGEVARPGVYEIQADATLIEALTLAGGPTPRADLHRASFASKGKEGVTAIDLQALLKGADGAQNRKLQTGDTLILHESHNRVVVLGEVARQGEQALEGNDTALDLLIRAGGPTSSANLGKATIMRRGKDGRPEIIPVDLKKLTSRSNQVAAAVTSGDLLFIPPRENTNRGQWLNYLSPLTMLMGLFGGGL
jgi:protein involved in polysaccharide export with SLBB domain